MNEIYLKFRTSISNLIDKQTNNQEISPEIIEFTTTLTTILENGFITNKSLFIKRKLWNFIEYMNFDQDLIKSVVDISADLDERVSVFIKMSLMKGTLGLNMNHLFGNELIINEWFVLIDKGMIQHQ